MEEIIIMSGSQPLDDVQRWMQRVITHPNGVEAGVALANVEKILPLSPGGIESVILPSNEMSSVDRLRVYGHAYFSRLIECLRAQYPAVHQAIGDEAFDGLASGYLIENPSTSYSLTSLGHSFDAFLQATRPAKLDDPENNQPDFADFLIDLARLERTYGEVFHGPGPERINSLNAEDLQDLSVGDFVACRLIPHACVRLLALRFPVHQYATAIRQRMEAPFPLASPVYLVITRRDYIVRRFEVSRAQIELLSVLMKQLTIGEALQAAWSHFDADHASLEANLRSWFRDWSAAPLFAGLERSS